MATTMARPTGRQPATAPAGKKPVRVLGMIRMGVVTLGLSLVLDLLAGASVAATAAGAFTRPVEGGARRWLRRLSAVDTAATWAYFLAVRPWHLRWGATGDEAHRRLPGDGLAPHPIMQSTRAVTIHAPAAAVWPWLVQFGQGVEGGYRGGFYSYGWLENLAGIEVRSPDRIIPEYQHREAGDFIAAEPQDLLPGAGWSVAAIEPGRAMVLRGWGAFVLEPIDDRTTRLIARSRGGGPRLAAIENALLWEVPHFLMERGMLLGVKERAERVAAVSSR